MSFLNIFKKKREEGGKPAEKKVKEKTVVSDVEKETPRLHPLGSAPSGPPSPRARAEGSPSGRGRGLRSGSAKPKRDKKTTSGRAHVVLVRPIVSEKATDFGQYGKYVFEVAGDANKIQVKKAIQDVYGVEAIKVNIVNKSGKNVRFGRTTGKTKARKKAVVTLRAGETISLYEGV